MDTTVGQPVQLIRRLPRIPDPHYHKSAENEFEDSIRRTHRSPKPGETDIGMYFTALAWFPDGRQIATGSEDCTVLVLDAESGKELARHHDPAGGRTGIKHIAVSPDGRFVAFTAAAGPIRLWDWGAGRIAASFEGHPRVENGVKKAGATSALAFSPDGKQLLSGGEGGTVRIWNLPDAVK